jgi:hypothetical protein
LHRPSQKKTNQSGRTLPSTLVSYNMMNAFWPETKFAVPKSWPEFSCCSELTLVSLCPAQMVPIHSESNKRAALASCGLHPVRQELIRATFARGGYTGDQSSDRLHGGVPRSARARKFTN